MAYFRDHRRRATGVELAGALGEIAHHTLRHNFRQVDPSLARIILWRARIVSLPVYPPDLGARHALARSPASPS
jgi:NADH dehydrogenase